MKVLDLRCAHGHGFEGWFASDEDFSDQHGRGLVECPVCADKAVTRMPSAPRLNLSAAREAPAAGSPRQEPELQAAWMNAVRQILGQHLGRIERILKSDVAYLAHEYFNKDWTLFFFQDVVQELRAAKLTWLSTATMEQTEPSFYLSRAKLALVREVQESIDREQMRDFLSNASFRRDVFLKGTPDAAFAREPFSNPAFLSRLVGPRRSGGLPPAQHWSCPGAGSR